jgi:hypothetical protein
MCASSYALRNPAFNLQGLACCGVFARVPHSSLMAEKLGQSADKMRREFRRWDASRNGQLSRSEFVGALEALRLGVPRAHLDRLFDLADRNGSGEVDYYEFASTFDKHAKLRGVSSSLQALHMQPASCEVMC